MSRRVKRKKRKGRVIGGSREENERKRAWVASIEDDVRRMLMERGMMLRVGEPQFSKTLPDLTTFHWMVEDEQGRRIVDFWPVSGTWYCKHNGERGTESDPFLIGSGVETGGLVRRWPNCAGPRRGTER